jgi:hypothetical protein
MPVGLANSGNTNNYAQLRNNAAKWWFQDAGMRKLSLAILVGFASTINGGTSLSSYPRCSDSYSVWTG